MFRSAQHGQMVLSLEMIVSGMMMGVWFQTVLSTSTQTITFHTTTSIPKVRIPLHEQFLTLSTTQIAADSGSVVHTRLVSLSAPLVLSWISLVVLMVNATTCARVHKDSNGHSHSTRGESVMPLGLV